MIFPKFTRQPEKTNCLIRCPKRRSSDIAAAFDSVFYESEAYAKGPCTRFKQAHTIAHPPSITRTKDKIKRGCKVVALGVVGAGLVVGGMFATAATMGLAAPVIGVAVAGGAAGGVVGLGLGGALTDGARAKREKKDMMIRMTLREVIRYGRGKEIACFKN